MGMHTLINQNQQTLACLQAKDFDGAVQSASCALRHLKHEVSPSDVEIARDALDRCMHMNKGDTVLFTYDCALSFLCR